MVVSVMLGSSDHTDVCSSVIFSGSWILFSSLMLQNQGEIS